MAMLILIEELIICEAQTMEKEERRWKIRDDWYQL